MVALKPITSSMFSHFGYDAATQTLALTFNSGGVYHAQGIPPDLATQFEASPSKGKFFGSQIKGKFELVRVA